MLKTDTDRAQFLQDLDNADCDLSDWDCGFLESNLDLATFSDKQRSVIDRMYVKYGSYVPHVKVAFKLRREEV